MLLTILLTKSSISRYRGDVDESRTKTMSACTSHNELGPSTGRRKEILVLAFSVTIWGSQSTCLHRHLATTPVNIICLVVIRIDFWRWRYPQRLIFIMYLQIWTRMSHNVIQPTFIWVNAMTRKQTVHSTFWQIHSNNIWTRDKRACLHSIINELVEQQRRS